MSDLLDFAGSSGGAAKPFLDLGTVTGLVELDLENYSAFRVVQGAGDITLSVIGSTEENSGFFELFFYNNPEWSVTLDGIVETGNGFHLQESGHFDLSTASYDEVSFLLSGQDVNPLDFTFSPDGTKMFVVGFSNDSIFQYTLTTEFDISTASYDNVSFNIISQDTSPRGVEISSDGTKMFMLGASNRTVYQYTLTTGFDLSTASYDNISFSIAGQDTSPYGITFNADGTKMFMVGIGGDRVYQYTLTMPYDLTTISYDNINFGVSDQDTSPYDIAFNQSGTKMYMVGTSTDLVYQYTLTTGFDLSTASYDNISFSIAGQDTSPYGITFNADGTKMFMVGIGGDRVYQYSSEANGLFKPFEYVITNAKNKTLIETFQVPFSLENLP